MSKRKFKVGDRVKITGKHLLHDGMTGIVIDVSNDESIGIECDEYIPEGHTCGGKCPNNHGWYCAPSTLTRIKKAENVHDAYHKLVIYKQGRTVTAKYTNKYIGYTTTAIAKCSPQDTFDFLTGAQIALARLIKAEGVKPVMLKEAFNIEII